MTDSEQVLVEAQQAAAAWGWNRCELTALQGGLINATFAVKRGGAPIAVLQRLHPIFAAEVNLDILALTAHLAKHGLATPNLLATNEGQWWITQGGRVWRSLSWIDGTCYDKVSSPGLAAAGGELVGTFHRALADFRHKYNFVRVGVHDTALHLAKLRDRLNQHRDSTRAELRDAAILAQDIVRAASWQWDLTAMPRRHIHGDLKISNLMFWRSEASEAARGKCLLDLDTIGTGCLAFELGDAMRSWCNPHGEDTGRVEFDLAIFRAAMTGFIAQTAGQTSRAELISVVHGLYQVCVELAARFCVDIFDDSYFGWDQARFSSRREHNRVRALGQLALANSVAVKMDEAIAIVDALWQ